MLLKQGNYAQNEKPRRIPWRKMKMLEEFLKGPWRNLQGSLRIYISVRLGRVASVNLMAIESFMSCLGKAQVSVNGTKLTGAGTSLREFLKRTRVTRMSCVVRYQVKV